MKKLKIGVVIDQLLPGGVQIAAIEEVKNLCQLGIEAKLLILMRKKYSFQFQYLTVGVPSQYLSDSYPWPFRSTIKFPIFAFFSTLHLLSPFLAPRVIKEKDYDVLISHGTTTCFTTLALWWERKIPYFAIVHDPIFFILKKVYSKTILKFFFPIFIPLSSFLEKAFIRNALATVIVSSVHQKFIKKNYRTDPIIIPHGCHVAPKISPKRGSFILALSRWQKEKNPQFLLSLLKEIPKAKLLIAGVWTNNLDLAEFKKRAKGFGVEKRLKIISQFSPNDLPKLFAQARVFVHPNFEAFGLGGLEAASFGYPIIVPAGSGVASLFRDGIEGFFPKKITIKEYKKYIKKLLDNEGLAYKMGKNAWERVKEEYSWQGHTKKLLKLVKKSLKKFRFPKITALEISHAGGTGLAGGDKLFEEMVKRMPPKLKIEVITTSFGSHHWRKATESLKAQRHKEPEPHLNIRLSILKPNPFEAKSDPISVFLSYCHRMIKTSLLLIGKRKKLELLYSSTNILPDILPAFSAKLISKKIVWIARIHHLIPPPHKREGKLIVNIVSYLMQDLALLCMKTKADLTIALNETLYRNLLKIGFPQDKLSILGAGINFEKLAKYQPKKVASFDGVYLGRLHVAKGIFDTVEIWKKVVKENPQAKLAIIGAGPEYIREKLQKKIKRGKLTKNIKILGFLPENQVFDYLKQAKIFLFTDHEAGWGLAIGEAMAAGLPVVGYNLEGVFGDVYKKGYNGVELGNIKNFAKEVIYLLRNEKERKKLSQKALIQAKNLDWQKTTKRFLQTSWRGGYF